MKIVIVEDEIRTRNGLAKEISLLGEQYEVVASAKDGVDGIRAIELILPDLVITDIKMPNMDGLEMLAELKKKGIRHKTIILSGHAEFDYAKKAITLGVNEYILKPVSIENIRSSIEKIEMEISEEIKFKKNSVPAKEEIIAGLAAGKIKKIEAIEVLKENYNFKTDNNFILADCYFRRNKAFDVNKSFELLRDIFKKYNFEELQVFTPEYPNEIFILYASNENINKVMEFFQNIVLVKLRSLDVSDVIVALDGFNDLKNIDNIFKKIKSDLKLSFFSDRNKVICNNKENKFDESFNYPEILEKNILSALHSYDFINIKKNFYDFINFWYGKNINPIKIENIFMRFITLVINTIKSTNPELYSRINHSGILKGIIDVRTVFDAEDIFDELLILMEKSIIKSEKIYSSSIKRALSYIHNNFMKDINLSDIAEDLDISNVYLSTLFFKETGKHYAQYLKDYRVAKAIEFLLKEDSNIEEISAKTGFATAKYFYKVFKEITGYSPGEYKKIYRLK